MRSIEKIKLIFGIILTSFAILGGLIFFLESFKIIKNSLDYRHLSVVFQGGGVNYNIGRDAVSSGGGASNIPIFLGLCGLAGTFLLTSITRTMEKNETTISTKAT